jgi:PAS domain S-box-containing protein
MEEEFMESANELYREIVEQAPDGVIVASIEGKILLWNDRAEAIFGYSRQEVLGQSLDVIIPVELRKAHWDGFNRAISEGRTRSSGHAMITKSFQKTGNKIYVDLSFAVLKNPRGEVVGALAIARDATERYTEEKSQRAELNKLRKQFRSND